MERETFLLIAALVVCGPLACAMGLLPPVRRFPASGRRAEAVAWRRLWLPLCPSALVLALLVGWATQEPDPSDERFGLVFIAAALPWALVWARAVVRAARSLKYFELPPAATVGIFRPSVYVAPELEQALDERALDAAREHEAAHARHRDPLRGWLAQLAADLQWPWSATAGRLTDWRHALELARDEEARVRGVDGGDLADAILTAAKRAPRAAQGAVALISGEARLRDRIGRLLEPVPDLNRSPQGPWRLLLLVVSLSVAVAVGVLQGEVLVRSIPGIGP